MMLGVALMGCDKGEGVKEAEGASLQGEIEASLTAVIDACSAGDIAKAAPLIVYRGPDKARKWKAVCDAGQEVDKMRVEAVCGRISDMGAKDGGVEVTGYETESESEGTWHILKVTVKGSGDKKVFAFLKIGEAYALGDID